MERICDLHAHTIYSDGTFTPRELVKAAKDAGLAAVALTDHNTVDGLPEFLAAAKELGVEGIPATEFSVYYNGKELHLIGMFLPEASYERISEVSEEVNRRKQENYKDLLKTLRSIGYELDYEELRAGTPKGNFNRAHVAKALVDKGYMPSVKEAFSKLLNPDCGYYKEPERLSVWEILEIFLEVGAVPVLAHPFLNLTEEDLEEFLPLAKERGLVGMECAYSLFDAEAEAKAKELALRYGLKFSGGSDFHGEVKPDISLGTGKGSLRVPYAWLEALRP